MEGNGEGLKTAVRPEFFEDVLDMIAHGGRTDAERISNPRRALTQRKVRQHFSLPPAQWEGGGHVLNYV